MTVVAKERDWENGWLVEFRPLRPVRKYVIKAGTGALVARGHFLVAPSDRTDRRYAIAESLDAAFAQIQEWEAGA